MCLYHQVCADGACPCPLGRHKEVDSTLYSKMEEECLLELAWLDSLEEEEEDL